MTDAWKILGLDPASADEKQVRSVYARLLKLNRPDQNPEGFQQLRHAYEHALQWLRRPREEEEIAAAIAEAEAEAESSVPSSSSSPAPVSLASPSKSLPDREWPHRWSFSVYALDAALKKMADRNPREASPGVRAALEALAVDAQEQFIPGGALVLMIEDAFDFHDRFHIFAHAAPELLLLRLLEDGGADILRRTLSHWERSTNSPRMASLASYLTAQDAGLWDESNADIAFRILRAIAFHRPALAGKLAQILRGQVNLIKHAAAFEEIAIRIQQGHHFRNVRAEARQFWGERLAACPELPPCDWSTGTARLALTDAISHGPHWSGFETARSLVPADVWDAAWRHRRRHSLTRTLRGALKNAHGLPEGTAVAVIVLIILGLQHCSTRPRTHNIPAPPPAPPQYKQEDRSQDQLQKSLQELLKKAATTKL
ncbi:MAG: hypothetical protein ACO1TE_25795 [Prosthecobacter sp.]